MIDDGGESAYERLTLLYTKPFLLFSLESVCSSLPSSTTRVGSSSLRADLRREGMELGRGEVEGDTGLIVCNVWLPSGATTPLA
jgi:hypothetical protein